MLIAEGTVQVTSHARATAADAIRAMVPPTLAEEGCHAYRFAWDLDDDTVAHIYEEWEDEDALAAHMGSDHMRTFNRALGATLVAPPDMRVHEVARTRPMFE